MMDSSNRSTLPHTFWKSFLAWVVTSSLITPLALLMGAIAGFIITPPDLGPFMGQPPREPLTILLIRALANSIISGSIIGLSQSWIVRQFVKVRFWIPATIIGLAFGDAIFYYSIDSGWVYIPWWGDFWQIVPALSVAISQAFLIYRKEYKVIWWLLAGGASIATSFIGLSIGDSFDSLLEQAIRAVIFAGFGALFSGIALLVTFRERLVIANSSNISPT